MRLIFDRNFKFRGFSDSLSNVAMGTISMWLSIFGTFLAFAIFPLGTYFLIKGFWKAEAKFKKSQWNPLYNPIPFIILNLLWVFMIGWMISGEAFKPAKYDTTYKQWDFNDPKNYNPVGDKTYKLNNE